MTKQHDPNALADNGNEMFAAIESGKYVTEKDRVRDIQAEEEMHAKHIVQTMQNVEPFGDIPSALNHNN